jgi:hypothetical protein
MEESKGFAFDWGSGYTPTGACRLPALSKYAKSVSKYAKSSLSSQNTC